jgi:hypothetical protein
VVVLQVPGDGLSAGIETPVGQLFAQRQDQFDGLLRDRVRGAAGSSRARLERAIALEAPAGDE